MRIGFFTFCKFHRHILKPVFDRVRKHFTCVIGGNVDELVDWKPDIIVSAEHLYGIFRKRLPETLVVWTRHGFSTKNHLKDCLADCDFACVSSDWVRDDCIRRHWLPRFGFWVTGYPPTDQLFRRETSVSPLFPPQFAPGDPVALYAPTFTPCLNAQEVLGNHWFASVRRKFPRLNIIIKPHPHTPKITPEWIDGWKTIAVADLRVHLVEDTNADVYNLLPQVDVLISDVSSVMFYYLALDRPIILVTNPRRHENPQRFDPEGCEWTWRDMGIEVENEAQLINAIGEALENPVARAERRAFYRERVFGAHTQGDAAEQIADKLRALASPGPAQQEWVNAAWRKLRPAGMTVL